MVASTRELTVALRSLQILEKSLDALSGQLTSANPNLLTATSPTYARRIGLLQAKIAAYFYTHPSDVSRLAAALPTEALAA